MLSNRYLKAFRDAFFMVATFVIGIGWFIAAVVFACEYGYAVTRQDEWWFEGSPQLWQLVPAITFVLAVIIGLTIFIANDKESNDE